MEHLKWNGGVMMKNEIRKRFKEQRALLSEEDRRLFSRLIAHLFVNEIPLSDVHCIHLFKTLDRLKEPITSFLYTEVMALYPSVKWCTSSIEKGSMEQQVVLFNEQTDWIQNQFGIEEPKNKIVIAPTEIDIVIVPLLAFDKNGHRVGYGKGYYDALLRMCRVDTLKIGISFYEAIEEEILVDAWDVALNSVITPQGIHRF
ncbi:MAG: 5-formyltetrahydrofolate cyclo-ligase [Cytophagaceae bacterium]|jgi:5-formyltetrahydrofolate cyclo-ligase|nr:5-formyltetrahydrofolate cyclo-ligase [Cytophagaceae bacterium]